jgi:hypothetical protein
MMPFSAENFDPDFAGPGDWAAMYRYRGLQVIPCYMPNESGAGASWKRPRLSEWATLQESIIPDASFDRWYGISGEYANRLNMGILTGRASGNVFVIDLDDQKGPTAAEWWRSILAEHNHGIEPETWRQFTGGGGRQILFRAPHDWHAPTNRTPIGVDIRGQGGFAVMPASIHETGRRYEWAAGCAPFEIEIAQAPDWLLAEVEKLVEAHGGDKGGGRKPSERTASPGSDYDSFGNMIDGREDYMTRCVWYAICELYRESPIIPSESQQKASAEQGYLSYERGVKSRLTGVDKTASLEREGRGPTEYWNKWRHTIRKWDTAIAAEAMRPRSNEQKSSYKDKEAPPKDESQPPDEASESGPILVFDINGKPKDRAWVVPDWIPEGVVSSLSGDGGVGKTLLAQQLLYAAGVGGKWLGMDIKPIRGMGVFCEDDEDELHRRHDAIKADLGFAVGNPFTDTWMWPRVGFDNLLVTFDKDNRPTVSPFFASVMKHVLEKKIGLLFLDTIADLFGGNEIVRAQVNYFIKATCGSFIQKAKKEGFVLTVILLSHPSQAGKNSGSGESGSTAWNNAVRARLYLTKPDDGLAEQRVLTRKKSNYSASGDDVKLELLWSDGVLKPAADNKISATAIASVENQIIQLVAAAWDESRPYKAKKGPRFLDAAMVDFFGDRVERAVIITALNNLRNQEKIVTARVGDRRGYLLPSQQKKG